VQCIDGCNSFPLLLLPLRLLTERSAIAGSRPDRAQSVSFAIVDHTAIFTPIICWRDSFGIFHHETCPGNSPVINQIKSNQIKSNQIKENAGGSFLANFVDFPNAF
jgi:hypothetical protein